MYHNTEINERSRVVTIDVSSRQIFGKPLSLIYAQDVQDLVLHVIPDAPPPNWLRADLNSLLSGRNAHLIQKVIAILVPGLTLEILALPPFPTVATSNPNLPISIPLLNNSQNTHSTAASIPFIASTFTHACPTRAPGDQTRMHSVLSTSFNGSISGEEKKRRIVQRLNCTCLSLAKRLADSLLAAAESDPSQYTLSLASYMGTFSKNPMDGSRSQPVELIAEQKKDVPKQRVFAIDYEMMHQLAHSTSDHFCNAILRSGAAIIMPAGFLAELLLTLRTWAIWGKGKQLGIYLFGGFALVWVEIIVCEALVLKSMTSTNPPPPVSFLAGCIVMLDGLERYFIAGFASVFAFDLTILFLMVSRGFKLRQSKDFQRLSAVAYRDGITYYLFITGTSFTINSLKILADI
ncbi:hypothetical protein AN958_03310 [Leucoagaricus sp. SymC.cos]|nr:hypothetical protein AN958_03310 [Leucoagaricus sp. SymC.cos]